MTEGARGGAEDDKEELDEDDEADVGVGTGVDVGAGNERLLEMYGAAAGVGAERETTAVHFALSCASARSCNSSSCLISCTLRSFCAMRRRRSACLLSARRSARRRAPSLEAGGERTHLSVRVNDRVGLSPIPDAIPVLSSTPNVSCLGAGE